MISLIVLIPIKYIFENTATSAGGTFLHHQSAKMHHHPEFVNLLLKDEGFIATHNVWHYEFQVDLSVSQYFTDNDGNVPPAADRVGFKTTKKQCLT